MPSRLEFPFLSLLFYICVCPILATTPKNGATEGKLGVNKSVDLFHYSGAVLSSVSLPAFMSSRLIIWEKCKPAKNAASDAGNMCCRGNYRCSHPNCKDTPACSMPFLRGLLWCFHDSCPKSKPKNTPKSTKTANPTANPTISQSHASQAPSSTPHVDPSPSPSASLTTSTPTHSPTPSASPVASDSTDLSTSCKGVRTRREIRDLSIRERLEWQQALLSLKKQPADGGLSEWDRLVQAHVDHGDEAHGGAYFLPWHRLQLLHLENAIRRTRPNFALPYWDWTIDAANAAKSPVWQANLAGGARPGSGIVDGAFADLEARLPWPHLVTRDFDSSLDYALPQLWTRADIDELVRTQSWPAFADAVEAAHALVHVSVGGDMMDTRTAPNDPVFWLLHGFVDAIFDERIRAHGVNEFGGTHDFVDGTHPATQSFILHPFDVSVREASRISCVRYAPASIMGRSIHRPPNTLPPDACAQVKSAASNKTQVVSRCRRGFRVLQSQRGNSTS